MKIAGEVRYDDVYLYQGPTRSAVLQKGKVIQGFCRGKLVADKSCIIFEDLNGIVHVVKRRMFFS